VAQELEDLVPVNISQMCRRCWAHEPETRPTFADLIENWEVEFSLVARPRRQSALSRFAKNKVLFFLRVWVCKPTRTHEVSLIFLLVQDMSGVVYLRSEDETAEDAEDFGISPFTYAELCRVVRGKFKTKRFVSLLLFVGLR